MPYTFLSHTGDVKFRASGKTMEEMFSAAAVALSFAMKGKVKIEPVKETSFRVEGKDNEELLQNFLEEFLYLLDAKDFLMAEVKEIVYDEGMMSLDVIVLGDDAVNYDFVNEVKAITYNEMFVRHVKKGRECQVVLDV